MNSVIIGWIYIIKKWIEEGILKKMIIWELDMIKRKFEVTRNYHINPHKIYKELLTDIDLLKEWEMKGILKNSL
jgi:hypothetical protein